MKSIKLEMKVKINGISVVKKGGKLDKAGYVVWSR